MADVRLITSGKYRRFHGRSWLTNLLDVKTWLLNIIDAFKILLGTIQSWLLLRQLKPDLVFSKGGYVAVPVGIAAHFRRLTIITHDSDATPGLANRFIGRWAKIHAVGLPTDNYPYPKSTIRFTGVPVNPLIKPVDTELQDKYRQELSIDAKQVLLVGGAGLGAQTLNDLTVASAAGLLEASPGLHILHLTGQQHLESVEASYQSSLSADQLKRVTAKSFVDDLYRYSGAADLIVTRPGATAMAEFAVQGKACIIVPASWLPDGHQTKNAKVLVEAGAAKLLDNDVSATGFQSAIEVLLDDDQARKQLVANLSKLAKPDAADELAKLILSEVRK